ncbi:MAG: helix-turn-helix transcriptional regulator [Dehalococcoidia bacterium]
MNNETNEPGRTELLTVPEAARRLNLSQRSVWVMIADGRLPALRFGVRATRVDAADVERLIADAKARSGR